MNARISLKPTFEVYFFFCLNTKKFFNFFSFKALPFFVKINGFDIVSQ